MSRLRRRDVAGLAAAGALGLGAAALMRRCGPDQPPSRFVGHAAPALAAPRLDDPAARFDTATLRGRPWVLNLWASWCAPCIEEHPLLLALSRQPGATLVGLAYVDRRDAALAFLQRMGNPFTHVLEDAEGTLAAAWGVSGVPQTFGIDAAGTVRAHHVGKLTAEALQSRFVPLLTGATS